MQADFGELAGIVFAEVLGEIVLEDAVFQGAVHFGAPFFIAATGFPVGDIALGDDDAVFVESTDDFGIRNMVAEHAINHIALEVREVGDFAVASEFSGGLPGGSGWLLDGCRVPLGGGAWKDLKLRGVRVRSAPAYVGLRRGKEGEREAISCTARTINMALLT